MRYYVSKLPTVQPKSPTDGDSISALLSAGGMGLWHGVEHYEKMKITEQSEIELFVKGWPNILQKATDFRYDWSYIVAWVGVGMCVGSAILFTLAGLCIKNDKEREEAMNMQYLMPGKNLGLFGLLQSSRGREFLLEYFGLRS